MRPAVCYLGLKREGRWQRIIPAFSRITDHGKAAFKKTGSRGLGGAAACPCAFPKFPGLNHVHCLLAGEEAGSG